MKSCFAQLNNPGVLPLAAVPELPFAEFRREALAAVGQGARVSALTAVPDPGGGLRLYLVLGVAAEHNLALASTRVAGEYAALTTEAPSFHWFERELHEQHGVVPQGHPCLKPVRYLHGGGDKPVLTDFYTLRGSDGHEVAVGPVHAGVIEPGHFRFQCLGEEVVHLEIALGYQHRGIEAMLRGGPDTRTIHLLETAAGDSSTVAAGAYCQMLEAFLPELAVPARGAALRALAWELERLASHAGDMGALAGDVAFLPTQSFCGRLRGEFLNMTAAVCGNRFGRGWLVPGGSAHDVDAALAGRLREWLQRCGRQLQDSLLLLLDAPTVLDRFENTGTVSLETSESIGLVGVAARACGSAQDVRHDFPYGYYLRDRPELCCWEHGDVFARAKVRQLEVDASLACCRRLLESLPDGAVCVRPAVPLRLPPEHLGVSLAEGWRGETCQVGVTDGSGRFAHYKVVDPSFHNWFGLAMSLRQEQISNFPICNKSFNLSYCGHDL